MKKLNLLFLFCCFFLLGTMAEPIDQTKALTAAQSFLKNKRTASGARRYAPGQVPQITLAGQVNGLYVYNVKNSGGFVIVSNDDATIPILGFSDSGNIEINHIPSNMKAWLQGYADEIAWYQKHSVKTAKPARKAKAGNHPTDPIAPLLTTIWNQDAPFNDLCPLDYNNEKSASGCVATAMAQVMNFHKWPQSETTAIPGYVAETLGLDMPDLPATTFDWANMKDDYRHGYTSEEGAAVAKLMLYCGYALEMDYGPSSGSYPQLIAPALKNYFDYNESAQMVVRSLYTTAKWHDLIYHELVNGRPVMYSGVSSGGGHEFVCDGYRYDSDSETDFFHINWGWGGTSDNYFVLSALNPYQQGIGGSSSDDGFNINQCAVIGIQPSTGTGSIADIKPNNINLTVNRMTLEANPAFVYKQVNITLNITNNSDEDYDGEIYLGNQYEVGDGFDYDFLEGDYFVIPAGETRDIVIPFTPSMEGTYNLVVFLPNDEGTYTTDQTVYATLTTTLPPNSTFVPVYINENNELSLSQFIIPATDLQDMLYAKINAVDFSLFEIIPDDASLYFYTPFYWGSAEFDVYLAEVSEPTFTDTVLKDWNSLEKVYSGSLLAFVNQMRITFDTPYQYMGGNLLVGIRQKNAGDYKDFRWAGAVSPGASLSGSSDGSTPVSQRDFLPFTVFDYTPGTVPVVAKPLAVSANYTSGTTAEVKWTSTESAWDIEVNGTVTENITNPYTLSDLEPATVYTIRVRAKNASGVSEWSTPYTFNTELADEWCQIRFDVSNQWGEGWNGSVIRVVDKQTGVLLGMVANTNISDSQIFTMDVPVGRDINFVWLSGGYDEDNKYTIYDVNADIIYSEFRPEEHTVTWCAGGTIGSWHIPSSLAAANIGPHSAELSWTENGEATAWVVAYKTADDADFTEVSADTNPFTLTGLDPEKKYAVRVRPATDEATKWSAEAAFATDIANAAPTRLAVTPRPTTADITWADFADSYEVRYGLYPDDYSWLQYDNDAYKGNWGYSTSRKLTWGVMYPNSMVENKRLTKVSWFEVSQYYDSDITVKVYSGVDSPVKLLFSQNVTPQMRGGFHEVTLPKPVSVTKGENLWIMLTAKGTKVISYCVSDESNNQWIYNDGEYGHLSDLNPNFGSYGFMIRGCVESDVLDESAISWTTTTCSQPPYQLTGLTPETKYVVQVRGDYGEDGISQWGTTTFTTISPSAKPNTLSATDVTANTATLIWTGYQNAYDLRYKVKQTPDMVNDFDDSSLGNWTTIDANADGYDWVIYSTDDKYYNPNFPYYRCGIGQGHNGSVDRVVSGSYSNSIMSAITPDNYLVSPQVRLGGTISFWAYADSYVNYKEHFGIAVSTTGNTDAADFTTIQEWTMDKGETWKQYIVDLSAYEGQTGYVAIRHFGCYDQLTLNIDDIVIAQPDDGTPWTVIENIGDNYYDLTGLDPQTDYWVQVRGNITPNGTPSSWSQVTVFTTLNGGTTAITPTDLRESQNSMLKSGWFSLDGRRLNSKPTQKGIYIHNGKKVVL